MRSTLRTHLIVSLLLAAAFEVPTGYAQASKPPSNDSVENAQTPRSVEIKRPEQRKRPSDDPSKFAPASASPITKVLNEQPEQGKIKGFDFFRDPLNAKKPMETFEEIRKADEAAKPKVMDAQRKLLESRYELTPRFEDGLTMSRGKPIPIGPTAKLRAVTWEQLADKNPSDIKGQNRMALN